MPDPITAPVVRRAFELYASGRYTLQSLREELHKLGLRNNHGRPLSLNSITTMLHNPFYFGLMQIKGTGGLYEGIHEPLINKSLFDQVQTNLRFKKRNTGLKHAFLYRRLFRCASCGIRLIPERQKGHAYYRCHTATCSMRCVREETLIAGVDDALFTLRLSQEDLELLAKRVRELITRENRSTEEIADGLRLARLRIEDRLRRAFDAYDDGLIDKEAFKQRQQNLILEKADVEEAYQKLHATNAELEAEVREILERISTASQNENLINALEKRDLLETATSNLTIDATKLGIAWQSPYHLFSKTTDFASGAPCRGTPRTVARSRTKVPRRNIGKLARDLVRELKRQPYSVLRPEAIADHKERAHRERHARSAARLKEFHRRRAAGNGHGAAVNSSSSLPL